MAITEAVENYLETILILSQKQPDVHAIDICSYLGYSRPTVSIILKKMKDEGLVTVDDDNHIRLTDAGRHVAERIYDRHNVLTELFILLGVSRDIASEDACKVEHDISDETFAMLKSHYRKLLEKSDKK
ncbi:metal-dependent transcriptional regulator [Ruminococcus flavefaciens]|jgi:Mn-dependent DtxR family transcriptional regulator|uniref:Iron (Metal) dependent repressor, DtxR family n=1 Tax=Ruminococcus flavefaciens TaxID=1265 RepID=A0A1K1P4Z0_RUMFL|nr:metal-dependent transcriptional regulator [Ruminococcus flavefaciens]SFW42824.1 iron (metal) dependent repressor, DtxR family [Ruminococcus flavefaciens]